MPQNIGYKNSSSGMNSSSLESKHDFIIFKGNNKEVYDEWLDVIGKVIH